MIGNLFQAARLDAARFASDPGGFGVTAILTTPDGLTSLPVTGLGTGTWMVFEDIKTGKPTNSTSNSFDIPIDQLIAGNYPYQQNGRPYIVGHTVIVSDGAGMAGTYKITEQHPNATLGLLVCILGRSA